MDWLTHLVIATLLSMNFELSESSTDWITPAHKTMYEASMILDRATAGFKSFTKNKTQNVNMVRLSQSSSKLAGLFGVFGALFSIILAFIPAADSPELKLMKVEFGKLSEKVDEITRSIDDTKNLIKHETQKATYLDHERKIHHGYSQLQSCIGRLDNVSYSGLKDCKRKKVLVAEGCITSMNVLQNVEAILIGVTSDATFGDSLLELLKEKSKCNVPKINLFANKVTALLAKGIVVSMFYDLLTEVDYNVLDGTVLAGKMLQILETKRQVVQHACFKEINYWMPLDVIDSHEHFSSSINSTNTELIKTLKTKYPWIWWHVFTYKSEKEPQTGPSGTTRRLLYSSSNLHKVHSFVIPTNVAKVRNLHAKIHHWKKILASIRSDGTNGEKDIVEMVKADLTLKDQIQSFGILPGQKWFFGHYEQEFRQQELVDVTDYITTRNVFVSKPHSGILVAVSFKQADYPPTCSDPCNGKGKCFVYPYSTQMGCRCNIGHGGEKCESLGASLKLKSVINSIVEKTMKLPTFASIQHSIQDTQLYLKTSTENIQKSITELGERIDEQFKNLGEFMSNKFEWFATLSKYKEAIENMHYFHSISSQKISHFRQNASITSFNDSSLKTQFLMAEDTEIAKFLLSPTGIRKWLYQINFLIVGRRDTQFNAHKSLIFMVMDKNKHLLCSQAYDDEITRTYRQLMLLQLQGYMLWSNAFSIADRDSSVISESYNEVLGKQQAYLQNATCQVNMPHRKLCITVREAIIFINP